MEVKLVIVDGKHAGKEIPVSGPEFLIGRGTDCRVQPRSHLVSRKHCAILVDEGSIAIKDFGSTNGTHVNGERIQEQQQLKHGDRIKIGTLEVEVQLAVSVAGKMKSKVQSVQEAASRTVASATKNDEELDISGWLEDDDDASGIAPMPEKASVHDTAAIKNLDDTVSMPVHPDQEEKQAESKASGQIVGQFKRTTKPKAESSRSAAEDMLRQFFHRK